MGSWRWDGSPYVLSRPEIRTLNALYLINRRKETQSSYFKHLHSCQSDLMRTCICPAHLSWRRVIGESVWQTDTIRYHHPSVLTVHCRTLDLWSLSVPVCPVQSAVGRTTEGLRCHGFAGSLFFIWTWFQMANHTHLVARGKAPGNSCLMLMRSWSGYSEQHATFDPSRFNFIWALQLMLITYLEYTTFLHISGK